MSEYKEVLFTGEGVYLWKLATTKIILKSNIKTILQKKCLKTPTLLIGKARTKCRSVKAYSAKKDVEENHKKLNNIEK